jgi:hypothetical protein
VPVPFVDPTAAARLFRHKVIRFLEQADLIDQDRVRLILGWKHTSGFSVHNAVLVAADDGEGIERLARYLMRPPVALERLEWDRDERLVTYRTKAGDGDTAEGVVHFDEPSASPTFSRAWSFSSLRPASTRSATTAPIPPSAAPAATAQETAPWRASLPRPSLMPRPETRFEGSGRR